MPRINSKILYCLILLFALTGYARAQTVTYHLHKEASTTAGLFQLKKAAPDATALTVLSADLKGQAIGEKLVKEFDTQSGEPSASGVINSGSTISFTLWMRKTANQGTMFPRARLNLNSAAGTSLCTATGATALTTTLTQYTLTCTTTASVTLTTATRFYLWVGVNLTAKSSTATFQAELDVEGTANGNYDSRFTLPLPPPSISGLSVSSGPVGTSVTVNGSNFGTSQGTSTVSFNGTAATASSWSAGSIATTVPSNATTGQVVVNVGGVASNGITFTVTPQINSLSPASAARGASVNISGTTFGSTQGTSTVTFNGVAATPSSWTSTLITAPVPSTATSGPVIVTAAGNASNAAAFTVILPGNITGKITKADGTTAIAAATVKLYQGNSVISTATTNATGDYTFSGLSVGSYTVEASASGYATKNQGGVSVTNGGTTTLNLSLDGIVNGLVSYIYDDSGRLISTVGPTETVIYSYDAVGNLLSISRRSSSQVSIISMTPNTGAAGASVTIYGTGFSPTASQNSVSFNGTSAAVTAASATQLLTGVPTGATTGTITVSAPGGSATSSQPFTVTASTGTPTISGFTPTIGAAGTTVSITGTNFETAPLENRLKVNVSQAPVTAASANALTATMPAGTSGRISVTTPAGFVTSSGDFYIPPAPYTATDVEHNSRISPGQSRTVTISSQGKMGMVIFDGTAGQRITMNITGVSVYESLVTIYNPNGTVLSTTSPNANGGMFDTLALPATGTYTVLVDPTQTYTGSMTLTLYDVAPDLNGTITPGGAPVTLTTTTPGQNAQLTFNGTAGERVSLLVSGVTINAYSALTIRKPDGSLLTSDNFATLDKFIDTQTLPATGTYSIFIDPPALYTGSATLTLYDVPPDMSGTITLGGSPATVSTTTPGQNARLSFNASAGQLVSLRFENVTIAEATFTLINPDGSTLLSGPFGSNSSYIDTLSLPANGSYTMLFDPTDNRTGSATVTLYDDSPVTSAITPGGPPVTLTNTVPGQDMKLTFSGSAGQRVSLNTTNGTFGNGNLPLTLKAPDGTLLLSTSISGFGGSFIEPQVLPFSGTYTILADVPAQLTGSMTFTLYDVPGDTTGSITIDGQPASVATATPGQNAQLIFSATAGQQVSMQMSNVAYANSTVTIKKPDGTVLVTTASGPSGNFMDGTRLPDTGTYTILIDPAGANTGGMTLNLYNASDVTGTIATGGPAVTVTTTVPGQNARLSFNGNAGQAVSIRFDNGTFNPNIGLAVTIYKPDGTPLSIPASISASGGFVDAQTLPVAGSYSILIDPPSSFTGSTTVTLYDATPIADSVNINGAGVNVNLNAPGQNGNLTFTGTAGQQVTVRVTNNTVPVMVVNLIRPDGVILTNASGSPGSFNLSTQTLTVSGTYTINIDPSSTSTGSLTVSVTNP